MKKILTLAASLMVVTATAAMAGGVNIGWNECFAGGGTSNLSFACNSNAGALGLAVVSVVPSVPMTNVVSATVVMDVQTGTPTTPAWWALQPGGCRSGAAVMDFAATFDAYTCLSVFQGTTDTNLLATNTDVIGVGQVVAGVGGPNRIRFVSVGAVQPSLAATVDDVTEYAVVKFAINKSKSAGAPPACAGCNVGATLVVNEVKIQQPLGEGDQRVVNAADRQGITYTSTAAGAVAPPTIGATPTQNRTWGAVKSLYR